MTKMLVGYCGRYCAECLIYIASTTSNEKQKEKLARKYSKELDKKLTADNIHCWGCRADNKNCWGKDCQFRKCADDKGMEFCYQCSEYPCPDLMKFYEKYPEAKQSLQRICKIGVDAYISEISSKGN